MTRVRLFEGFTGGRRGNRTNGATGSTRVVSEKRTARYNVAKIRSWWRSSGNIPSLPGKLS